MSGTILYLSHLLTGALNEFNSKIFHGNKNHHITIYTFINEYIIHNKGPIL